MVRLIARSGTGLVPLAVQKGFHIRDQASWTKRLLWTPPVAMPSVAGMDTGCLFGAPQGKRHHENLWPPWRILGSFRGQQQAPTVAQRGTP